MIINREQDVTDVVLDAMSRAPDDRLRTVMASFVRHLHAFARDVRLTEAEFEFAIDFLNRIGQATNDTHNEGVLFSDAVGLSTTLTFVSLVFWAFIIGPIGAIMAVPLSLLVRSLLVDADPSSKWLVPLLANRDSEAATLYPS